MEGGRWSSPCGTGCLISMPVRVPAAVLAASGRHPDKEHRNRQASQSCHYEMEETAGRQGPFKMSLPPEWRCNVPFPRRASPTFGAEGAFCEWKEQLLLGRGSRGDSALSTPGAQAQVTALPPLPARSSGQHPAGEKLVGSSGQPRGWFPAAGASAQILLFFPPAWSPSSHSGFWLQHLCSLGSSHQLYTMPPVTGSLFLLKARDVVRS